MSDNHKLYLFTTKTCPNCNIAKKLLEGINYELIDAEENVELSMHYGIMQAPTLIVNEDIYSKYVGISNIKIYLGK